MIDYFFNRPREDILGQAREPTDQNQYSKKDFKRAVKSSSKEQQPGAQKNSNQELKRTATRSSRED
jgi:hypothetical protein